MGGDLDEDEPDDHDHDDNNNNDPTINAFFYENFKEIFFPPQFPFCHQTFFYINFIIFLYFLLLVLLSAHLKELKWIWKQESEQYWQKYFSLGNKF